MKSMTIFLIALPFLLAGSPLESVADENTWSSNGPTGGRIYCITIHPINNQIIYIGTIGNGIYRSSNGGSSWTMLEDPVLDNILRDIVIHPNCPDTLFAGTANGMYRSFDAGLNWQLLRPPGYWYNIFKDIEIHPIYHNIIFAGGSSTNVKSTDGGTTWYDLDLPWVSLVSIKTDPLRPDTIYAASHSAPQGLSVFRSEDLGETWYSYHNNLDSNLWAMDFQIDPVNSDIQYLGGIGHLYQHEICLEKTTDCGNYWFDITPPNLEKPHIWSITISPLDHNTVYICTEANGVLRSTDGGSNWFEINNGSNASTAWCLEVDSISGHLYLGTLYYGVFKSTDGGENWENIGQNINNAEIKDLSFNPRDSDSVYVAGMNGLFRSLDGALSWRGIEIPYTAPDVHNYGVAVDPYDPNYIFVSYMDFGSPYPYIGGIFRSSDGGENWRDFSNGLSSARLLSKLNISDFGNGARRVFLAALGLYYSDDLGENWDICQGGLPSNEQYYQIEISKIDPYKIIVTSYSQIFYSIDGGNSWINLQSPPGSNLINSVAFNPQFDDQIYIARNYTGVFKSTDLGQNWNDISNNLPRDPEFFVTSGLAINPINPENIFVNSRGHGIFISHNGGDYWEPYNEGLNTNYSNAITILDPIDTNRIFLAPDIQSVWTITNTLTEVCNFPSKAHDLPYANNYPNPFNTTTTLYFNLLQTDNITINIYNILGQQMKKLAEGHFEAGKHFLVWNGLNDRGKAVSSGIYFCRVYGNHTDHSLNMSLIR